jgi:hypothetical protein
MEMVIQTEAVVQETVHSETVPAAQAMFLPAQDAEETVRETEDEAVICLLQEALAHAQCQVHGRIIRIFPE